MSLETLSSGFNQHHPFCVCWRNLKSGATGRGSLNLHKVEAEQLCKKLNRQNKGYSEHWIEPVRSEHEATR